MSPGHQGIDLIRQLLGEPYPNVVLFGHGGRVSCRFINVTFTYLYGAVIYTCMTYM